jgi:hypothetical protein
VNLKVNGSQILAILVSTLHVFLFNFVSQIVLLNYSPEMTKMMMMMTIMTTSTTTAAAARAATTTTTTTQHMGNVKTKVVPVIMRTTGYTAISFRKYLSNIREITPINYRKES